MDDLVELLNAGCIYHEKRWSGDTHADLGGTIDEEKTDRIMRAAADVIQELRKALGVIRDPAVPRQV